MVERIKEVFGRVDLRIVFCLALGVLAATSHSSPSPRKKIHLSIQEEYHAIASSQLSDIYDLEQWFAGQQHNYLPLLPPVSDFILENAGQPNLLPFDLNKFPEDFTPISCWSESMNTVSRSIR